MEVKIGISSEEKHSRMKAVCQMAKERTMKIDLIIEARNRLLDHSKTETESNIVNIGADFLINML